MWEFSCHTIEITRTYDVSAFHDDLKRFMFEAGCDAKPVVFLFSDTQIVKESFLEDINNILNSGEVPNLMETEDMERILTAVRPLAKAAGKPEGVTKPAKSGIKKAAKAAPDAKVKAADGKKEKRPRAAEAEPAAVAQPRAAGVSVVLCCHERHEAASNEPALDTS